MVEQAQGQLEVIASRCGCGGEIAPGLGCLKFFHSTAFDIEAANESLMRRGGLGFAVGMETDKAVMSAHLQDNGFSSEDANRIIFAQPV